MKKGICDRYFEKYPEKKKASTAAQRMPKPEGYENHHWSYNEEHFKDVIAIPVDIHAKLHRYMAYDFKFKMYRTMEGSLMDTRQKHEDYLEIVKKIF